MPRSPRAWAEGREGSKERRRISVARSASGAWSKPRASSAASRKRSTSPRDHSESRTSGTGGSVVSWKAQCFERSARSKAPSDFGAPSTVGTSGGAGAPMGDPRFEIRDHRIVELAPRRHQELLVVVTNGANQKARCGVTRHHGGAAFAALQKRAASPSTRSSERWRFGPWHLMQCSAKTGRTLVSKKLEAGLVLGRWGGGECDGESDRGGSTSNRPSYCKRAEERLGRRPPARSSDALVSAPRPAATRPWRRTRGASLRARAHRPPCLRSGSAWPEAAITCS